MSWTTPKTWSVGDVLSAGDMNTYVRDNFFAVFGGLTGTTLKSTPADKAATTSTSFVMLGLAVSYAPTSSGRLDVAVSGVASSGGALSAQIAHGTGTAPTNGAAAAGTVDTAETKMIVAGGKADGFCLRTVITGLIVSNTYWIDLQFKAPAGDSGTLTSITVTGHEY